MPPCLHSAGTSSTLHDVPAAELPPRGVTTAGLRELRQNASELVRQAEAGAVITVSVSGRAVAELGPAHRDRWRSWSDVSAVFDGPADAEWTDDRERVDQEPHDPFTP